MRAAQGEALVAACFSWCNIGDEPLNARAELRPTHDTRPDRAMSATPHQPRHISWGGMPDVTSLPMNATISLSLPLARCVTSGHAMWYHRRPHMNFSTVHRKAHA